MNFSRWFQTLTHRLRRSRLSPAGDDLSTLRAEMSRLTAHNHQLESQIKQFQQTEHDLRANRERLQLISSVTSDYIYAIRMNPDGTMAHIELSGAVEAITGYTPEEFITTAGGWRGILHPDDLEQDTRDMEMLATNHGTNSVLRIRTKSGELRWVRSDATPVWDDENNRLVGIYGGASDVTESIRKEQALRESEQRFKTLVANASDVVTVLDDQGNVTFMSDSTTRILGYRPDFLIGRHFSQYIHPNDLGRIAQVYSVYVHQSDEQKTIEYRLLHADGSWRHMESRANNLLTDSIINGIVINSRDVTERVQAEQALRESETRLRALLDATTDVAFLMSTNGTFLTLNKAVADLRHTTVDEMVDKNGFDSMPPQQRAEWMPHFEQVSRTGQPVRFEDSSSGSWSDNSIYPVLSPSGEVRAFATYSRDISEQKRLAEQLERYTDQLEQIVSARTDELRHAKSRIDLILDNTSDAIALAHSNGDVQIANPAFQTAFDAPVSLFIEQILHLIDDEEQIKMVSEALLNTIESGMRHRVEVQIATEDHSSRDVDLVLIPVQMDEHDKRWGVLVSARDITQSKEFERFKTRFVADALHDLATPITGLNTRLYLLKRSPERLSEHTAALENQVAHLTHLLEDLRMLAQFGREKRVLDLELTDLNAIVQRVFNTYEPVAINKQQSLKLTTAWNLPLIPIDIRLIERVLVNLVSNAINYTENGKTIHIVTAHENRWALFTVRDEGLGISETDLPHIFERFYRSDQARQMLSNGTGLGLAIVKEAVEQHGGRVDVSSRLGEGSMFTLRLPLVPPIGSDKTS